MLDDFLAENGATRVVPASHRITRPLPKQLAQPLARHPQEMIVVGKAGSVLVMNGHTWHSGRRNDSRQPRRAAQLSAGAADADVASIT
jgi:ectoine hydroxylase-related dioxygenase (phytanoyl-CoA dioxygenase family)